MNKKKRKRKKKSGKNYVPPIPPLSPEALDDVQEIERYARLAVLDCQSSSHINSQKAERILRTCAVQVLRIQLAYYESLPAFHDKWIIQLQKDTIESAVGMVPGGYQENLYEHFREVLWTTTYADLNAPKEPIEKKENPTSEVRFAEQIKGLRDECRLTTEELAEKVDLDARSVQRHLAGKTQPYARHLRAYETAFSKLLNRQVVIKKMS